MLPAMSNGHARIAAWLRLPLGRALLSVEAAAVRPVIEELFGLHVLQLGHWSEADELINSARAQHRAIIGCRSGGPAAMVCKPSQTAIASDSVDAVLLPHTLELDPEPHDVLRETERILVGEGSVVVIGFNPWSSFGVRRSLSNHRFPPGVRGFISERRLCDWLRLLGFEIGGVQRLFYRLPINSKGLLERTTGLERVGASVWSRLGASYVVRARKRVFAKVQIKRVKRLRRGVVPGLVEPTTRISE